MPQFLPIEEPARPAAAPSGLALWALGFRPFYLLASTFSALSIGAWALQFCGVLTHPYLQGPLWHAHEMIFGFTLAVVVGFLFTAGRTWTNQPTPHGVWLMALAALWVAGRIMVLTPWPWAAAFVNAAFPLSAAVGLAIPFWKARNRRNYFFVGLLVLLSAAQLCVHLSQLGVIHAPPWGGIQVALDIIAFIVAVMAGRVVPMFTNNGVPAARATRHPGVERAALGLLLALLAADGAQLHGWPIEVLAVLAALAHGVRWGLWRPWTARRVPMVWVLHAAYAWLPVHLLLRAAAQAGWVTSSVATHALTVGVIGGLIIGMITRTARGHTARPLRADAFDVACYVLVLAAAPLRVIVPALWPAHTIGAIGASAALWCAGFALYAGRYGPFLLRPRLDGRPG